MDKHAKKQSLLKTHPNIAKEWHPTKNGNLTPDNVSYGSNKYAFWICEKDHEYFTKICHRSSGSRCPYCYGKKLPKERSLAYKRPDLAKEFHPTKNFPLDPYKIHASSRLNIWWICLRNGSHKDWLSTVDNRNKGNGCPTCANKNGSVDKEKSFGFLNKHLLEEWDFDLNKKSPYDYGPYSNEKAHWVCKYDHKWVTTISHRSYGTGCPICKGAVVTDKTSLAYLFPEISSEWDYSRNNNLLPSEIRPGSSKKIYWICRKDSTHIWRTTPWERTHGSGCPHCINGWSIERIRLFISNLLPYLKSLDPAELFALFQQSGALDSQGKGRLFIKNFFFDKFSKNLLESIVDDAQKFAELIEDQQCDSSNDELIELISDRKDSTEETEFPVVETKDILKFIDGNIVASADGETVDFLIKSAVAKIWRHTFRNENDAQLQLMKYQGEGEYPKEVKRIFLEGYQGAKNLIIPKGYNSNPPNYLPKKYQIGLMQRYVAYQIKKNRRFGNWSGTGAGKTLSAILASRVIDSKLTVICCPNNVIDTWKKQINGTYPDSVIYSKELILKIPNDAKSKYLILNYEFFQQPNSEKKLKNLLDHCLIDFIVIDEIHQSKQRDAQKVSKRKMLVTSFLSEASNNNSNLSILGMSATPVINNLFEGKTLLELITGIYHDDLNTLATATNCIALYKKFVSYGIRYLPDYKVQFNVRKEPIDCGHLFLQIKEHKSWVELEAILTLAKLPFILDQLQAKTIVYTHYRDGIELVLQEAIIKKGWTVALYNGSTKDGLNQFINGSADILIATSCIGTGIDGLQKVCNRLIMNCLPWTHAEYKQLIGRIYRQGQLKNIVDIIIPLTFAEINGERWSWCESRWKRIEFKKSIADAAVDGVIPEGQLRSPAQAHKDIMKWFDRLNQKGLHVVERSKIALQLSGDSKESVLRRIADLSRMNCQINSENSNKTHQRFLKNPEEWYHYHSEFKTTRKSWPIVPNDEALDWCKNRPELIIGDFGCGEALLAKELNNTVYSFDHIAINEKVISCDMSHVPLDDETIDAAIFSLSLMGINFVDYLKEAKRCLKRDGWLWIAEPTSRIKDIEQFKELLRRLAFYMIDVELKDRFTFIKALKSDKEINEVLLTEILKLNILE